MLVVRKQPRQKHVPLRTCVGCREVLAKRALIRLVRTENGIQIDLTGRMSGRGAYLHDQKECWAKALKGSLAQALKVELTEEDQKKLTLFASTLG